jgi:predicted 3-demethylubiquinone-9 3-methyltransferase (glyoxalase superfamily)
MNGGPQFKFTEAISRFVHCESQEEVDRLWGQLSASGKLQQCGWLKDRYSQSWQIIPSRLMELMQDPDPVKAVRARQAMLQKIKIDVRVLEKACQENNWRTALGKPSHSR